MSDHLDTLESELFHLTGLVSALRATVDYINTPDEMQRCKFLCSTYALLHDVDRSLERADAARHACGKYVSPEQGETA